ncbi:MAG: membrane protein insertase YidC [Tannerella sp.]|jgi:YidC/Oxa1 family membrane protein insertase|nr:membrane protein insertase YidC [Tannerella sp.]
MDKNTVLGFVLIGIVLVLFTWLNKPSPEQIEAQRRYQDSIARIEQTQQAAALAKNGNKADSLAKAAADTMSLAQTEDQYGVFADAVKGENESITLQNDKMELHIDSKGGRISFARLKEYVTADSLPLVLFGKDDAKWGLTLVTANNRVLNTANLYFNPVLKTDTSLTMRLNAGQGAYLDFAYRLAKGSYMVHFDIVPHGLANILSPSYNSININWEQSIRQQEKVRKFEDQYTGLFFKYTADNVDNLSEGRDDSQDVKSRLRWIAYKDKFFSTVLIAEQGFEGAGLKSTKLETEGYLKHFSAQTSIPVDLRGQTPARLRYFFGPNQYRLLKSYDKGLSSDKQLDLEQMVPLGYSIFRWVSKYFLLPVFDFICKYVPSMGLAIFLLTLIVRLILFPLTYKSYLSGAKMRVLRPQVEAINAKYPGQDKALERQKATMALYSAAGASPMAGCLPMLIQMPVLLALYWLFPTNFDLRQQSFLWAHDLSSYDAILSWQTNIPVISSFYGNHVSLFCLLMTVVQIFYTKVTMSMNDTGQQQMPGMKVMMYLMPVMFLFILNQNASGLCYYYLVSSLITMGIMMGCRYFINEDKLLLKLEANKKKPRKKSKFAQRIEALQKQQQEVLRQQEQQKKKGKKR